MVPSAQGKPPLQAARQSIGGARAGRRLDVAGPGLEDALRRPAGAFVTLRTGEGDLRGCIGSIVAREPMIRAVISSAFNAAFRDPRFHPVTAYEWSGIELEISVIGPIERVTGIDDILPG